LEIKKGKVTKNNRDGRTNQKILIDRLDTFLRSPVSMYNQIMANNEVMGNEAIKPPQNEVLLLISEITTISTAEIRILRIYLIMRSSFFGSFYIGYKELKH
jgi:hypothetical protein